MSLNWLKKIHQAGGLAASEEEKGFSRGTMWKRFEQNGFLLLRLNLKTTSWTLDCTVNRLPPATERHITVVGVNG